MFSRLTLTLVIFGLILLAQSGLALRCWNCASNVNAMCGDPLNVTDHHFNFHTPQCEASSYDTSKHICRKIVKKEDGERVVIRQCSTPYVDEADITDGPCGNTATISARGMVESCHICSTDFCNSATSASVMQPLFIAALAVVGHRSLQSKYNFL
ncbi:uncharacterized protein LOC108622880 [Ceratina calcarata]|uniref:Uncharacterized protein LOC108622880 n=1 Tax=Ceratina calcarata TaxID=156304 RepID=A0AAJ7N4H2_9HYME|nr:uncharacterized protein LOC108622880 [Ceratina calcarata]